MKEKKLLEALNEIDDEFIEEAKPVKNKKGKIKYLKWITLAACFVLAISIAVPLWNFYHSPEIYEEASTLAEEAESEENLTENATEIAWEIEEDTSTEEGTIVLIDEEYWKNAPMTEKFEIVKYNSIKYQYQFKEISKENISRKIADVTVESTINNPTKKTATATLYEIKNIDSHCAVVVKFEEKDSCYVYTNRSCEFETLGEIIDKLNLKETLEISKSIYQKDDTGVLKYKPIDKSIVWKMLLDDTSLEVLENPKEIKNADLSVYFTVSAIYHPSYIYNSFNITKDGYLSVDILEKDYVFFIGKEKAEKFIEHVTENYEGAKLSYTTEVTSSNEIPVTEVISNGYTP